MPDALSKALYKVVVEIEIPQHPLNYHHTREARLAVPVMGMVDQIFYAAYEGLKRKIEQTYFPFLGPFKIRRIHFKGEKIRYPKSIVPELIVRV